jgi:hypothetical protein
MASFCGTYPIEESRCGRGAPSSSTARLQAQDDPEQGGLARAVRSDQAGELTGADAERDVVEDLPAAEPDTDVLQPEQVGGHRCSVET